MEKKKTIYLVDYENTNSSGLKGIEYLQPKENAVILFYTVNNTKIDIDVVFKMKSGLKFMARKVAAGKQALYNQLDSILGFLIAGYGNKVRYVIVSKDNGYRIMQSLWDTVDIQIVPTIGCAIGKGEAEIKELKEEQIEKRKQGKYRAELNVKIIKALLEKGFVNKEAQQAASLTIKSIKRKEPCEQLAQKLSNGFGEKRGKIIMGIIAECMASPKDM